MRRTRSRGSFILVILVTCGVVSKCSMTARVDKKSEMLVNQATERKRTLAQAASVLRTDLIHLPRFYQRDALSL
jgi:hypothetical protein